MGNCAKVPRTNSVERIRAPNPVPIQRNPPPQPMPPPLYNPQMPLRNNIPPPMPYNHYPVPNQFLPQMNYMPHIPSPIYNQMPNGHPVNYSISNVPLNNSRPAIQSGQVNVDPSRAIRRFSRIVDHSVILEHEGNNEYWINFKYITKYSTTITIYCFAREQFDKAKQSHVYHIDQNSMPKPEHFTVVATEDGIFSKKYKMNLGNIPKNVLEIADRCTFPIIIELCTDDGQGHSQILITKFKIGKEHDIFTPIMVSQTMKIDKVYKELFNLFGTSEMDKDAECLICLTEKRTIAVLPCRHVCYCVTCMGEVKKNNKLDCPVCRTRISQFLNIEHQ